jgi:hypothetical protein
MHVLNIVYRSMLVFQSPPSPIYYLPSEVIETQGITIHVVNIVHRSMLVFQSPTSTHALLPPQSITYLLR